MTSVFRCDVRALAAFRVGLAVLLLIDVMDRARDLGAHYSDFGVLPRSAVLELHAHPAWFSLYYLNGTTVFAAVLFLLTAACALALLFGWRTRLMTIAAWVLLVSLQNRNPLVLQGGDVLFRMLFFWAMFLPWEADRKTVASAATAALLLQLVMLYVFTGLLKTGPEWHRDLSAVSYALRIDQLATPFGRWLLHFPESLKMATWVTWRLEVFASLLFLLPWAPLRLILFAVFFLFQMGLGLTFRVSTFPWISTVAMLPFLPSAFWDWLDARRKRWRAFDGTVSASGSLWSGSIWGTLAVLFFLVYALMWNVSLLPRSKIGIPAGLRWVGAFFRVDQYWNMFAPYPLKDDGWFVIPGALAGGREVELFRGGRTPVSWDKPKWVAYDYKNQRWQKYMMNLWLKEHTKSRLYFAKYLCRSWNTNHSGEETLNKLKIYFLREDTLPDGEKPPEKVLLWDHDCFGK